MAGKTRQPWNEIPFLRIFPSFTLGLVCSSYFRISPGVMITVTLTCLCFHTCYLFLSPFWSWKLKAVQGIFIQLSLFFLAPILSLISDLNYNRENLALTNQLGKGVFRYILKEPTTQKTNFLKTTAEVQEVLEDSYRVLGNTLLYIPKSFASDSLGYGSVIISKDPPQKISTVLNPGAFDYRNYLEKQGIIFQTFLKKEKSVRISGFDGSNFFRMIYRIRNLLLDILKKYISDPAACGLAEALLTGYRNDVDQEQLQAYINTGVVHVIAISGLHLGLIYLILSKISGILLRGRSRQFLQPLLVISALWIFTFISGASASVVRSAVMFTLFALGNLTGRKSTALNTLLASAFLLLAFQPQWISDVGFQLSYSAVAGILLLHKKLTLLYPFTNWLAIRLWESICLTLAAQIFTTPLLLFYFHRFPLLFLFSNLIAVPLSSIILIVELLLCSVSFSGTLASKTGDCIQWLIEKMNDYILLMDRVPHSAIENAFLSPVQTTGLYLILFAILSLNKKNIKKVFAVVLSILAFMTSDRLYSRLQTQKQFAYIILHTPKHSNLALISGSRLLLLTDSAATKKSPAWLHPLEYSYRIEETRWQQFPTHRMVIIKWGNTSFLHFNRFHSEKVGKVNRRVDFILLSGNSTLSMDSIGKMQVNTPIVADASNTLWKIQKWKKDAERLHLRFHSVPEQGVFLLNRDQLALPE